MLCQISIGGTSHARGARFQRHTEDATEDEEEQEEQDEEARISR